MSVLDLSKLYQIDDDGLLFISPVISAARRPAAEPAVFLPCRPSAAGRGPSECPAMKRALIFALLFTAALPSWARAEENREAVHGRRGVDPRHAGGAEARDASPRTSWCSSTSIRIAIYEDKLHAAITVNPNALEEADALRSRARGGARSAGRCTAFPIALKDNIHTTDMPTTGGALAFDGLVPPYEATLTKNLRDAGAIIIAKTQMTELANWVAGNPPMPNNYNSLNGYGFNPYDPRRDPREAHVDGRPALNTGGSSSGAGTAASFWAANVGTETSGSILSPSNQNMLAGGQADRRPRQPLRRHPDHRRSGHARPDGQAPSPTPRILLGVLEGNNPDPNDPATSSCTPPSNHDYTQFLKARRPQRRAHRHSARRLLRQDHAARRRQAARRPQCRSDEGDDRGHRGAEGAGRGHRRSGRHPEHRRQGREEQPPALGRLHRHGRREGRRSARSISRTAWSATSTSGSRRSATTAPVKTLTDLREWNRQAREAGTIKYGQSLLDISDAMDLELVPRAL